MTDPVVYLPFPDLIQDSVRRHTRQALNVTLRKNLILFATSVASFARSISSGIFCQVTVLIYGIHQWPRGKIKESAPTCLVHFPYGSHCRQYSRPQMGRGDVCERTSILSEIEVLESANILSSLPSRPRYRFLSASPRG